ncbi:hypothetical protein [Dongia deserti]|uniref:hypothetical protein n=1 Tax=Dongia deserti TaxID=2268030 RepID=UPI000E646425|nr:hypothetical protein [Dongia deserti]
MLRKPRYLALDSSHLTQWARDWSSVRAEDRSAAADFSIWLERNGYVPLLTFHHIEEIANHHHASLVLSRLRFIGGMKLLAWIGHGPLRTGPGTVTDLLASEARAAYALPNADISEVRQTAASGLIQVGTGADLLGPDPEEWLLLRPVFAGRATKARQVMAFAHTNLVDIEDVRLADLLNGGLRRGKDLRRTLDLLRGSFTVDIAQRGDRRINDPGGMAATFVREIEALAGDSPATASELVLKGLAILEVGPEDFRMDSTVGEMLDLGLFRAQLKIVSETVGVPWSDLKRQVRMEQIPSWTIRRSLQRHAPDLPERKGSGLNDLHIACLSAYADVTFVDKRTLEAFRRARSKVPVLAKVCRRVERAAHYRDVPAILLQPGE